MQALDLTLSAGFDEQVCLLDKSECAQPRSVVLRPAPASGLYCACGDLLLDFVPDVESLVRRLGLQGCHPVRVGCHVSVDRVQVEVIREHLGVGGKSAIASPVVVVAAAWGLGVRGCNHHTCALYVDVFAEVCHQSG